jgi:hypothetical protein
MQSAKVRVQSRIDSSSRTRHNAEINIAVDEHVKRLTSKQKFEKRTKNS